MSALPSIPEPLATPLEADRAGELYEEYSDRILGYCIRRLPSREDAEDAVQHTFLNAYRGLRQGVVPRSDAAWLFKIAENVCRERHRSAWRRSRVETVHDPEGLAGLAIAPSGAHDELAGLADALAQLPPNQQRAILLREWQGLSYREIARELELTEAAVETLLFRARRSLAGKLDRVAPLRSARGWRRPLVGGAAAKVAATASVVAGVVIIAWTFGPRDPAAVSASHLSSAPAARTVARTPAKPSPAPQPRTRNVVVAHHPRPSRQVQGTVPRTRPTETVTRPGPAAAVSHARKARPAPASRKPKARPKPAQITQTPSLPAYTASDVTAAP